MASRKQTKGQSTTKIALEVGAGVAAATAAAAAGYYFYADKNAKKHRASASKWATGMKTTVVKEAKKLKKIDQKTVAAIVDKAAAAYSTARNVDRKDLTAAARELKKHWKDLQSEVSGAATGAKRAVTKQVGSAKKAAKKAVKKAGAAKKSVKKSAKKAAKRSR